MVFSLHFNSSAQNSCSDLLGESSSIVLPNELKTSSSVLLKIAENGHTKLLETLSLLFEKYKDQNLQNNLSYSFRRYNIDHSRLDDSTDLNADNDGVFVEEPTGQPNLLMNNPTSERFTFKDLWNETPKAFTDKADKDTIRPMFFAIRSNLGSGFLNDSEILITAILMHTGQLKFTYKTDGRVDVYTSEVRHEVTPGNIRAVKHIASNPMHIKSWNELIKDKGFKHFVQKIIDTNSISQEPMSKKAIDIIKRLLRQSFKFKPKSWQSESTIGLFLTLLEDYTLDYSIAHYNSNRNRLERVVFLNALEEELISFLDDPSLARSLLNFQDIFTFKTPFPVSPDNIMQSIIEGTKSILLPFKNIASQDLANEAEAERQASFKENLAKRKSITVSTTTIREATQPQRVNSKKRRKKKCGPSNEQSANQDSKSQKQQASLCADTRIKANEKYTFYMIRNSHLPIQTISFSEDIVNEFNAQNAVKWPEFIRPLLYGFTSENGQTGIKKIGNMNLNDIYEIRPGNSSYRIIMRRKGNTWMPLAFLKKDNVMRFIYTLY